MKREKLHVNRDELKYIFALLYYKNCNTGMYSYHITGKEVALDQRAQKILKGKQYSGQKVERVFLKTCMLEVLYFAIKYVLLNYAINNSCYISELQQFKTVQVSSDTQFLLSERNGRN